MYTSPGQLHSSVHTVYRRPGTRVRFHYYILADVRDNDFLSSSSKNVQVSNASFSRPFVNPHEPASERMLLLPSAAYVRTSVRRPYGTYGLMKRTGSLSHTSTKCVLCKLYLRYLRYSICLAAVSSVPGSRYCRYDINVWRRQRRRIQA